MARVERQLPFPEPEARPLIASKPTDPRPPPEKCGISPHPQDLSLWQTFSTWGQRVEQGGSLAGCGKTDDDLVWGGWGLSGGGGSLGCDFLGTSFPGWPSIRSRRLVDGFLLKPMSACEEVLWRSVSFKLGSHKSPEGSLDGSNWSNAPNSSSDWSNSMTCSLPSAPHSLVFAAC